MSSPSNDAPEPPSHDRTAGRRQILLLAGLVLAVAVVAVPATAVLGGGDGSPASDASLTTTTPTETPPAQVAATTEEAGTSSAGGAAGAGHEHASTEGPPRPPVRDNLTSIAYGERAGGAIDETDARSPAQRGYHERVTFEGSAGDTVAVTMAAGQRVGQEHRRGHPPRPHGATTADPYLRVIGPNGSVLAEGDDFGHSLNARVHGLVLPADGEYTIVATSFEANQTFPYTLALENLDREAADLRSIEMNATASGAIDKTDPASRDRRGYYEPVTFEGQSGQAVRIQMGSAPGDTYLQLLDPSGNVIAENDDSHGLNSTIDRAVLPEDGEYTIVATSFSEQETFAYDLSVHVIGAGESGGTDARRIAPGETVNSEIDSTDPSAPFLRGQYEPITFEAEPGQSVTIDMASERGDTYLLLYGPDGNVVARNDDHQGLNSQIRTTVEQPGEYTIIATSYEESATFRYSLSLSTGTAEDVDLRSIAYGETREGRIASADPSSRTYRGNYEPVTFEGEAGDGVSIEMTSQGDPYLILLAPNGTVVAENDDHRSLNSRIVTDLPTTGEYTIVATSYEQGARLSYELSLSRADGTAQ